MAGRLFQAARTGFDTFLRAQREAKAKAAVNSLEQNQAKLKTAAAEFVAVTTTYLPQVGLLEPHS